MLKLSDSDSAAKTLLFLKASFSEKLVVVSCEPALNND
jgi:hypothetical protein